MLTVDKNINFAFSQYKFRNKKTTYILEATFNKAPTIMSQVHKFIKLMSHINYYKILIDSLCSLVKYIQTIDYIFV